MELKYPPPLWSGLDTPLHSFEPNFHKQVYNALLYPNWQEKIYPLLQYVSTKKNIYPKINVTSTTLQYSLARLWSFPQVTMGG